MREIKFRAWNSKENKWDNSIVGSSLRYPIEGITLSIPENEHLVLQQFTGLKDKNGKEIYEGDILRHDYGGTEFAPVEFKDGAYFTKGVFLQANHHSVIEVIGNIYENPNLLANPTSHPS